jgi:hypothetical protein
MSEEIERIVLSLLKYQLCKPALNSRSYTQYIIAFGDGDPVASSRERIEINGESDIELSERIEPIGRAEQEAASRYISQYQDSLQRERSVEAEIKRSEEKEALINREWLPVLKAREENIKKINEQLFNENKICQRL